MPIKKTTTKKTTTITKKTLKAMPTKTPVNKDGGVGKVKAKGGTTSR